MDPEKVLLQSEVPQKPKRPLPPKKSFLLLRRWAQSVAEGSVKKHVLERVYRCEDVNHYFAGVVASEPTLMRAGNSDAGIGMLYG